MKNMLVHLCCLFDAMFFIKSMSLLFILEIVMNINVFYGYYVVILTYCAIYFSTMHKHS